MVKGITDAVASLLYRSLTRTVAVTENIRFIRLPSKKSFCECKHYHVKVYRLSQISDSTVAIAIGIILCRLKLLFGKSGKVLNG